MLVGGFERLDDLARARQGLVERDRTERDAVGERWALDEFQNQGANVAGFLETVHGRYVRVVERVEHLGLTLKARQPFGILKERLGVVD